MNFYMVVFHHQQKNWELELYKAKFNLLKDWYKFAPNGWMVWTGLTANQIFDLIQPLLSDGQHLLVTKIDTSDWWGLIGQKGIDWLKKSDRDPSQYTGT